MIGTGAPNRSPGDHRGRPGDRQSRDRRRRAPHTIRDRPSDGGSDTTRGDDAERRQGSESRVIHAGDGEAREQEERDPRPHREEFPHVPEIAEVDARRTDGSRNAAAAMAEREARGRDLQRPAPRGRARRARPRPGPRRWPRDHRAPVDARVRADRPEQERQGRPDRQAADDHADGQTAAAPEPPSGEFDRDRIDRGNAIPVRKRKGNAVAGSVARVAKPRLARAATSRARDEEPSVRAGRRRRRHGPRARAPTAKPSCTATVRSGSSRDRGAPLIARIGATAPAANDGDFARRIPTLRIVSCGHRAAGSFSSARVTSSRSVGGCRRRTSPGGPRCHRLGARHSAAW